MAFLGREYYIWSVLVQILFVLLLLLLLLIALLGLLLLVLALVFLGCRRWPAAGTSFSLSPENEDDPASDVTEN